MIFTLPMLSDGDVAVLHKPRHLTHNQAAIMNFMPMLPLTPDELLTTTRAVRKRLDLSRPVPLELVRECLEIALQAPSGSNKQSWHWVVVTDPAKRAAIGEIYRQQVVKYAESRHFAGRLFADRPD